jgi:transposase-like protein
VSDLAKKRGTLACPRCKAPMHEVVRIAPLQNEPGLIGYECPSCCYVTSVLTGRLRLNPNLDRPKPAPDRHGIALV